MYYSISFNGFNILRTWIISNIGNQNFKKFCANMTVKLDSVILEENLLLDEFINLYNKSGVNDRLHKIVHDNLYIEILKINHQNGFVSSIFTGTILEFKNDRNHFNQTLTQRLNGSGLIKNKGKYSISTNENELLTHYRQDGNSNKNVESNKELINLIKKLKFDEYFPSIDLSLLKLAMLSSSTNNEFKLNESELRHLKINYNLEKQNTKILEWYGDSVYNSLISEIFKEKIGISVTGDQSTFMYTQLIRNPTMAIFGLSLGLHKSHEINEIDLISRVRSPAADTLESIFGVLLVQYGVKAFPQIRRWFESLDFYVEIYNYVNKDFLNKKLVDTDILFIQYIKYINSPLSKFVTGSSIKIPDLSNVINYNYETLTAKRITTKAI